MDRRIAFRILAVALIAGFAGLPWVFASDRSQTKVEWNTDLYDAYKISVRENKPMLLVFRADWCGYCKKLEQSTLSEKRMVEYVNSSFVPVHLDLDVDRRIAQILEVDSLPCSIILSPEADLLGKVVGYVEADRYRRVLDQSRDLQSRIQRASHVRAE